MVVEQCRLALRARCAAGARCGVGGRRRRSRGGAGRRGAGRNNARLRSLGRELLAGERPHAGDMRSDRLPAAGAANQHIRRLVLVATLGIGLGADHHAAPGDDRGAVLEHFEAADLETEGTVDPLAPCHVGELGRLVGPLTVGVDQPELLGQEPIEKCGVPLAIGARPEHLLDLAQRGSSDVGFDACTAAPAPTAQAAASVSDRNSSPLVIWRLPHPTAQGPCGPPSTPARLQEKATVPGSPGSCTNRPGPCAARHPLRGGENARPTGENDTAGKARTG